MRKGAGKAHAQPKTQSDEASGPSLRFRVGGFASLRKKLGLSAAEMGKLIGEAEAEVALCVDMLRYYVRSAAEQLAQQRAHPRHRRDALGDRLGHLEHRPFEHRLVGRRQRPVTGQSVIGIAKEINHKQDLSEVKEGLHDEIYQAGDPVLVGCCARSTYCYLLKCEDTCDANAWGVHLLDLKEEQKLAPDFTVIDGGQAARKGQKDAWPEIPAHGDTFHALKPFLELVCYLENRAIDALKIIEDLNHKIRHRRGKWKDDDNRLTLS